MQATQVQLVELYHNTERLDWLEYITEAKRCLVTNGILIIVETTKSLKGRLSNLRDKIQKQGFDIYSDEERGDFRFIEAREL